ncbi:MAG TPA: hypothetical protein VHL77_00720 [Ferruginibacter sp.]|jgi:hypothetical protein|nr:hypothetical protein [Ferruginibacter sp.]
MDTSVPSFSDPMLQRLFLTPQEKRNKEKGKAIVKSFYSSQTSNDSSTNFFKLRNARWIEILLWLKGSQRMNEFLDYMNVESANKSYVNIDLTPSRIAAQFIGTLVESMAKNKTYPCVNAIDDGSMSEKEDRLQEALYRMHNVKEIDQIQQKAGMALEPPNAYVPDDEMSAKVYFELMDRLPKEIRFEKLLNKIQKDINFERILNRKTIFDLIAVNAAFTKIEKCGPKHYTVRKCIPTNMVYNFFLNDSGEHEVSQIGEFYNLKVKDARYKIPGITEKELFELAKLSTVKNVGVFNYMWNDNWALTTWNQDRPYDDNSIFVLDCEIDCGEDVIYVEKPDAYGRPTLERKNGIPYQQVKKDGTIIQQEKPDDVQIIKRQKNTWMRGIYAPYGDKMLYWGPPDLIICPYTNTARPLSSYTVNIPNNDGEYVPSLGERGIEVVREYQITKLKRKQLIAKVKPSGIRIDVESARNLDLGNGDTIAWEEVVRIYDQTGNELWSSKGVDPLTREAPPLSNTVRDESVDKIIGLTNVMLSQVQELRQLWGVPVYRDGADVGDRTAAKLAEGQNQSSFNVTDFILNGNNQLWEETFYKICLLHWNDIVKEEPESSDDMLNTRFDLKVKTKSTQYEQERLEQDIQRFSQMPDAQGNPSITLKDAMMIREIMEDYNYKLANWYLTTTYESNRRKSMEESQKLQQQNQELQGQVQQQNAEKEFELQQRKLESEKDMEEFKSIKKKEELLLEGVLTVAAKDETGQLIKMFLPAIQQLVPNISIPLAQENQETAQAIAQEQAQKIQQAQMQQEMANMSPEERQQMMQEMQQEQQQQGQQQGM